MTVLIACPSCGESKPLRLEGASRTASDITVLWYKISCTKCEMVFDVDFERAKEAEERIFPNTYRMREESQVWEGVP